MAPRLRCVCLFTVLELFLAGIAHSTHHVVESLPGYPGKLPFRLETGYVSVGDSDEVELFYYFIESTRNPLKDPLMLWLTGGPGCSAFSGLVYEIGPLTFDYAAFNGTLPSFVLNNNSWTEVASIIFLDSPVGTGFSYSTTQQGMIVPQVTQLLSQAISAGEKPIGNLQGYVLGNPVTHLVADENSRMEFRHRVALISDELYESVKTSCKGEYVYPNKSNPQCIGDLVTISTCVENLNNAQILEPQCVYASPKAESLRSLLEDPLENIQLPSQSRRELWCRNTNYVLSYIWANDKKVREALHIRNGTIPDWKRCNKTLAYAYNLYNVVPIHYNLSKNGYRALIYSGDHDMLVPYVGTQGWIASLNFTVASAWRPWFVHGQVAGYTVNYKEFVYAGGDGLTFVTVKGAGHTAPEYKPEECIEMIDRWLAYYAL